MSASFIPIITWCILYTTASTQATNCREECWTSLEEKCSPAQSERYKNVTTYYYNTRVSKCAISHCHGPDLSIFKSIKDCESQCGFCETILKHFKPDDKCLEVLYVHTGQSTKPYGYPSYWAFDRNYVQCTESDASGLKEDARAITGMFFNSKDQCEKRCPPIINGRSISE